MPANYAEIGPARGSAGLRGQLTRCAVAAAIAYNVHLSAI
jgi:hypothetical protein